MNTPIPNDWAVEIVTKGPCGHIIYREGSNSASFGWEFGGGDVVAIVQGGPASGWNEKYPWAANRREEVLKRMIEEVIRQRASACAADIDEPSGVIYLRERKQAD